MSKHTNFRIVENNGRDEEYQEFLKYFKNPDYSKEEICKIMGLTKSRYGKLSMKVKRDDGLYRKRKGHHSEIINREGESLGYVKNMVPRYYTYNEKQDKFMITKWVDGEHVFYGGYKDEQVVKRVVEALKAVDWDKSCLDDIRSQVL